MNDKAKSVAYLQDESGLSTVHAIKILIEINWLTNFKRLFSELVDEHFKLTHLNRFKDHVEQPDAVHDNPKVQLLQTTFRDAMDYVNSLLLRGELPSDEMNEIGDWLYREFYPYVHIGSWSDRALKKPYGPGDHFTTSQIYDWADNEMRYSGKLINYCFMQEPAAKAIRNRKHLFKKIIVDTVEANEGITSIGCFGCGPAKEIFEAYKHLKDPKMLRTYCVDLDPRPINNIEEKKRVLGLNSVIQTAQGDILTLGAGNNAPKNLHLVYSIGLMDYFSDRHVTRFLNTIYENLKPGGRCIIGNYETRNPTKALMDYILKWPVYHRSEDDMAKIFANSKFGSDGLSFFYEHERVNLFADIRKREV